VTAPGPDPYLDPASGVLRNLLGITDARELSQADAALTASRLVDLERRRLPGGYNLAHLQEFHRYIFADVYDWAGRLRKVPIGKGGEVFGCLSTWTPTQPRCSADSPLPTGCAACRVNDSSAKSQSC
jgi:fido (protein-threonine AMPylation protein)